MLLLLFNQSGGGTVYTRAPTGSGFTRIAPQTIRPTAQQTTRPAQQKTKRP